MTSDTDGLGREWTAGLLLLALGVGTRLTFTILYPTLPFWDFLQMVHFGVVLRDQGLFAAGWYWGQFNPGLPMLLSLLFRIFPGDPIVTARTATAIATGLVPLIPFLAWRRVLAFRWRLIAGTFLALWPGQIFFSGAVAQDNWVLLPTIALGSLAVRRLLDPGDEGRPVLTGLLYASAFAIRQEMALVLLPLVLAAAAGARTHRKNVRQFATLGLIVAMALLLLAVQRKAATGRFAIATDHGALGLFGSFAPGASFDGWIDARAYAAALDPTVSRKPYGSQRALVRLTWEEMKSRPTFHLLRIAAWVPRLALNTDADNLFWSVGAERSQSADRRSRADRFRARWVPLLKLELAVIQGLFAAAVVLGIRRRNTAILVIAAAVLLKFLVHAFVSPLGRLVVPAVALELLTIALAAALFASRPARGRFLLAGCAAAVAGLLLLGTPPLARFVIRHDSPILPGVQRLVLRADPDCEVRCELRQGAMTGLAPTWARIRTTISRDMSSESALVTCALPVLAQQEALVLEIATFQPAEGFGQSAARIRLDARDVLIQDLSWTASAALREIRIEPGEDFRPSEVAIELLASDSNQNSPQGGASLTFRFTRVTAEKLGGLTP